MAGIRTRRIKPRCRPDRYWISRSVNNDRLEPVQRSGGKRHQFGNEQQHGKTKSDNTEYPEGRLRSVLIPVAGRHLLIHVLFPFETIVVSKECLSAPSSAKPIRIAK